MIDLKNNPQHKIVKGLERYYLREDEPRIKLSVAAACVGRSRGHWGEVSGSAVAITTAASSIGVVSYVRALYGHYSSVFLQYLLLQYYQRREVIVLQILQAEGGRGRRKRSRGCRRACRLQAARSVLLTFLPQDR
eukprot:scaffold1294_cov135-Skeletonema_menzelii.AAC.2